MSSEASEAKPVSKLQTDSWKIRRNLQKWTELANREEFLDSNGVVEYFWSEQIIDRQALFHQMNSVQLASREGFEAKEMETNEIEKDRSEKDRMRSKLRLFV